MKFSIKDIVLLVIVLAMCSCENEKRKKNGAIAEQEETQKELQKQLDAEFGEYVEEVKPEDREYYKAYDKALALWKHLFMN